MAVVCGCGLLTPYLRALPVLTRVVLDLRLLALKVEGERDPSCDVEREGGRGGETPAVMLRGREGGGERPQL